MDNKFNGIGNIDDERSHAIILVIDDAENSRTILKRRLSIYGNEVVLCDGLESAYKRLEEKHIDVIFIEYSIKKINGYEILKILKNDQKYVNIPIIVMGTKDDTTNIVQCIEAGAEDYLLKPFNPSLLKARLANAISKKQAHDKEVKYIAEMQEEQRQVIAKEKMTSLGNVATAISEELKNPLNLIINLSEVSVEISREISDQLLNLYSNIKENFEKSQIDEISDKLKNLSLDNLKIAEQGKKADKILRFMMDQSQLNESVFYETNLNKLITEAIKMFIAEYKMQHKTINAKIVLKLDNRIPNKLKISAQAFGKALFNLFENAVYFLDKKETNEEKIISITSKNNDDSVDIFIKDNGCGIEKNKLRVIFEPFFTTKVDGEGQGLGLAAVSEVIVRMHKGSISVSSEVGKFTEFKISIPK